MSANRRTGLLALPLLALLLANVAPARAEFRSYAIVQKDATLRIAGRTVRLYGIHIPRGGRYCRTFIRPIRCGSEAMLALAFRIQGFVRCDPKVRYRDRSLGTQKRVLVAARIVDWPCLCAAGIDAPPADVLAGSFPLARLMRTD